MQVLHCCYCHFLALQHHRRKALSCSAGGREAGQEGSLYTTSEVMGAGSTRGWTTASRDWYKSIPAEGLSQYVGESSYNSLHTFLQAASGEPLAAGWPRSLKQNSANALVPRCGMDFKPCSRISPFPQPQCAWPPSQTQLPSTRDCFPLHSASEAACNYSLPLAQSDLW